MPPPALPTIVVAVLTVGTAYALQHRDDVPGIAWPGHWGLFGGNMEPGETPTEAVTRELEEEIGLRISCLSLMWRTDDYRDEHGRARQLFVFAADIGDAWRMHRLGEGQGAGVFAPDELPAPVVPMARAMITWHWRNARQG
jgi:8-oxo-dGTP pyrophosphatase MutT (NUDIX family)